MGQGTCSLYWTEEQSPLWVQILFLIADYKTFFDLSFQRHYTDILQISLFLSQNVPFLDSLGNNQQSGRQCSYITLTWCPKVHVFMIPVILPSGNGLGVCNKAIIQRKTWKMFFIIAGISSTQFPDIWYFSMCYFYDISQGCESALLEIPTTWPHDCLANRRGKGVSSGRFPLLGLQNHCGWWLQPQNQKTIASWQESNNKCRQCVEKQRHYSADKHPYSQGYGLPSGHLWLRELYHKEDIHQRIDAFELWCWRRLLKIHCTARRSNQSILREINPDYSLEGLRLKLKLPYFHHLM